jgi:cephalosporin-C deacetylase-like acetyl esterase
MDQVPKETTAALPDIARLAKSGKIVLILQSRATPIDAQNGQSTQFALGPYMGLSLRAVVTGKTLVGLRADDAIRVVNWLTSRPDVDRTSITLYGKGALGMSALHAAALDARITHAITENTLVSYRTALDAPLHRNLSEYAIPGILRHYDVSDLMRLSKARITAVNPVDAIGQAMRLDQTQKLLGEKIKVTRRAARDPLPVE